jgi:hypothetical protein
LADDKLYIFDSCAAIAFLQREPGAAVLTSDHHELDPIAQAAICPIRFIR